MICPVCGGRTVVPHNQSAVRDFPLHHEETIAMEGCLCFYPLEELSVMLEQFEESFSRLLGKYFEECQSMDDVRAKIRSLPKHSPIRSETARRMVILDRVREKVRKGQGQKIKAEEAKDKMESSRDEALHGEAVRFRDWTKSFGN